jgi:parallel beta-helix repeat protein
MMRTLLLFLLTISFASAALGREWFVRQADPATSDTADGSGDHPFRTINVAAQLAQPGDTVSVGPGIYHEWVVPARGGSPAAPILYRSVPEHAAIVRGTDVLEAQWEPVPDSPGVFTAPLPQSAFIPANPFAGAKESKRYALVFLNDRPLAQVTTREQLVQTTNSWLSSNDGQQLLVHLEGDHGPAKGAIEITTRDRVFAPHRRGLGYIQVEGFVFERCATRPGWPQLGALSTRTGNHWTIRNNIARFTTGKGIDCGSETWSPELMLDTDKSDNHLMIGGHHLVESNILTDNAECGIAAWNTDGVRIIGNIVSNNASVGGEQPRPPNHLADAEAAGIKVHAFRDGVIEGNLVISNSSFGIWLDNGWEHARVTRNLSIGNRGAGIFVELGFGPILVDHNLSVANIRLWPPYFGDGIYTHDASGITIAHNTFLENAHYGVEQIVVTERVYWPKRMAEASHETITGNLFFGNKIGAVSLPLLSPRSHDNLSDHNAIDSAQSFGINNNSGRIPMEMIFRECRDRLQAAEVPTNQRPDVSDPKRSPTLSLPAWQVVMQMDQKSKPLPEQFRMQLDACEEVLHIDLPSVDCIPTSSACPGDDFDLLGEPVKHGDTHAGAIENLLSGTIRVWPLPTVARAPQSTPR